MWPWRQQLQPRCCILQAAAVRPFCLRMDTIPHCCRLVCNLQLSDRLFMSFLLHLLSSTVEPGCGSIGSLHEHTPCCKHAPPQASHAGHVLSQDPELPAVLIGMEGADKRLNTAFQRPGMLAGAAAWDPDAVPVLCTLAFARTRALLAEGSHEAWDRTRSLLQPVTMECVRCVQ
jgi:hypothetical protein